MCVKRKRRRRIQHANIQEQMGKYEREQEVDRANRALQRAREVLAHRTGNADWNPELTKKNEVMQLMDVDEKTSAPVAPPPGGADVLGGVDWAAMGSVPRCVPIAARPLRATVYCTRGRSKIVDIATVSFRRILPF